MRIIYGFALLGFTGIAVAAEPPLGADDYSPSLDRPFGWRGDGSGRFSGANPPTEWSSTKKVRWNTLVGFGFSSPILTQKLAFVTSEPNRLTCINRADGTVRWKLQIKPTDLADDKSRKAATEYEPPKDGAGMMAATPVTDGKSVYVAIANGIICAVDLDGKIKWTACIDADQNTGYGRSSSPLLVGGKLIVHMTNLYAFDPATGKQLWVNTEAPSKYGTPTVLKIGDVTVIVTPGGDVVRLDNGKTAATDAGSTNHSSPVTVDGVVYFGESSLSASKFDAKFKQSELWSGAIGDGVFGSPLVHNGFLFTATGKGELFAFDAKGKGDQRPLLDARPFFGKADANAPVVYASITLAGKYLFLNSNHGDIVVFEATRDAKEVSRNRLAAGTGSSPIFSGKEMFIRDGTKLYCIGE